MSSKMMSVTIEVVFSVEVKTEPGEVVCIVGDHKLLGNWDPHHALRLSRESSPRLSRKNPKAQNSEGQENSQKSRNPHDTWKRKVKFDGMDDVKYRYFVCNIVDSDSEESDRFVNVLRWEANIKPRVFSPRDYIENPAKYDEEITSVFGDYEARNIVNQGWLTDQSQIVIKLHSNPIEMWKPRYRTQTYRIKCSPIDYRYKDQGDEDDDDLVPTHTAPSSTFSKVCVAILDDEKCYPTVQEKWGEVYRKNDYMLFNAQSPDPENLGFQVDFYVETEGAEPKYVGYSHILPTNLKDSSKSRNIPIQGLKHKPIGQLKFEIFVCKPLAGIGMKMDTSFQKYWKWSRAALDVGHRGMGSSYKHKKMEAVRENTIASLQSAGSHGADYVEFDVQLSKDMIPVIYHDFHVCITYRKKKKEDLELFRISVKDLNLEELQCMKVSHVSTIEAKDSNDMHSDDLDHDDLQPFPTLKRCFEAIDPHVGFNIEVKYPLEKKNGTLEDENPMDRNKYVDTILRVVFESAGNRRIIFSSFDPDCLLLLRLKQNRYPVLFLTNGETDRYEPYKDTRCTSVAMAKNLALYSDILGIDVLSDILITKPEIVESAKKAGLVVFCWGEANNDSNTINKLKQMGIDGIIYDKIDQLKGTSKNIFQLEQEQKTRILAKLDSVVQLGLVGKGEHDLNDSDSSGS